MSKGRPGGRPFPRIVSRRAPPAWVSPTATTSKQPHDQKPDDGADRGINDLGDEARSQMNAKLGKQQGGDQRAGDADQDVADNAKAGAADDLPDQPARLQA